MKKGILAILVSALSLTNFSVYAQAEKDTTLLGLPGDNLDLYAVLDLFLKSKTIEEFEKSLNEQKTGINNLDLDLDKKVDFIKVVTTKKDDSYTFVLQIAVSKTETQDVAVILVDRDKNKKVSVQMVGDKELYGKDYIIEPKTTATPAATANPAYVGPEPAKTVPATPAIVVETVPIVQYVYSPVYVPYVPPYYYGFYPPYFAAFTVMAVGIYRANNYYHHGGGYGYHNTVVINNHNHYNNYNNNRNTSDRVQHHNASGDYGNRGSGANRPSNGGPSASTRPSNGASGANRPSTGGPSASTRPSNGASGSSRPSAGPSASNNAAGGGRSRSSSGSYGGGGGASRGGGGGGSRGGGGRRR